MSIAEVDWNQDIQADPEEEYQALVRSIQWTDGFGLFFVRCSPLQAQSIIERFQEDLEEQTVEVITLTDRVDNLYEVIDELPDKDNLDVLILNGLEESFVDYIKPGIGGEGDYYKLDSVPRVLGNLNLQRERFRDDFPIAFVLFLPLFGLKYFIRRAPDFFDWRSGVFEFLTDSDKFQIASQRVFAERETLEDYLELPDGDLKRKILELEELLVEEHHPVNYRAQLLFECAMLLDGAGEYRAAIQFYDRLLKLDETKAGVWYNRGIDLASLGEFREAVKDYDRALSLQPEFAEAWDSRGIALKNLKQYEEAIASFDRAVELQPDFVDAWYNRGNALTRLGYHREAIASFEKVVSLSPSNASAHYNLACVHTMTHTEDRVRNVEQALGYLKLAITLDPGKYIAMAQNDEDLEPLRGYSSFKQLTQT